MSSFSRIGATSAEKIPKTIVTSPVAEPNPDDVEPKKSFIDFFKAPKSPFTPAGSVFYTRANAFPMNPVLGYSNRELKADLDINIPGVHTPIAGKSMGDHNSAHIYIRYSDALTTTGADKETTDFVLKTWSDADLQKQVKDVWEADRVVGKTFVNSEFPDVKTNSVKIKAISYTFKVDKGPIVTPELAKPEKSATGELEVTMSLWVQWFKTNGNRKMYAQWVDVDIDALENIDNVIASEKDPKKLKTLTALKTWKTTSPIVQADIDLGKMLRTKERAIDVLITSTGLFRYPPLKPAKQ